MKAYGIFLYDYSCKYGVLVYEFPADFVNRDYHNEYYSDIQNELDRNSCAHFDKKLYNNCFDSRYLSMHRWICLVLVLFSSFIRI